MTLSSYIRDASTIPQPGQVSGTQVFIALHEFQSAAAYFSTAELSLLFRSGRNEDQSNYSSIPNLPGVLLGTDERLRQTHEELLPIQGS